MSDNRGYIIRLLTPTLKVKRGPVVKRYAKEIDELY